MIWIIDIHDHTDIYIYIHGHMYIITHILILIIIFPMAMGPTGLFHQGLRGRQQRPGRRHALPGHRRLCGWARFCAKAMVIARLYHRPYI